MENELLKIRDLRVVFQTEEGRVRAIDGLDLVVNQGDTVGVVGESGCGKTVTALSIMRLIPEPPGRIEGGSILFEGRDLNHVKGSEMRKIRGNQISMIFQEPMTSLNPVFKIGTLISENVRLHRGLSRRDANERAVELLKLVGIPSPELRVKDYPHHLSGGMRQRVMIAIAISCHPKLLIADEPTTALDVTIQAQILSLIQELKEKVGTSIIFISHNLGIIAEIAQKVVVMYAGRIMEFSNVVDLFENPYHPYTIGLMKSMPVLSSTAHEGKELYVIPGVVPDLAHLPRGCRFSDRCSQIVSDCYEKEPPLLEVQPDHSVRCWLFAQKQQRENDEEGCPGRYS